MKLNRKQIVSRHNPVLTKAETLAPLSIGNGEFGFSVDVTGLQTFYEDYETPLGTQSNWGWHYTGGPGRCTAEEIVYQEFETYGRKVPYPMKPEDRTEAYHWLRQNPHRLQLGQIGLKLKHRGGQEVQLHELEDIRQELDLWSGIITSRFSVDGQPVTVVTSCHQEVDALGISISSPLIQEGRLQLFTRFPAPDMTHTSWSKAVFPGWDQDERHQTEVTGQEPGEALLSRSMDEDRYEIRWTWSAGKLERTGVHELMLHGSDGTDRLECTLTFASADPVRTTLQQVENSSRAGWQSFWKSGGAVDFSGSVDERAGELERRVVLSQYLTAIHSSGELPPQETGLMYNSWFGKAHLEMHWWHAVHFPLWGRVSLLKNSMDWYLRILPLAKELAVSQGYAGARWPKMVGFDGLQSPSAVAVGLIWQQPHPMTLAELIYRAEPGTQTLDRYADIVFEAADFMVSYAHLNPERNAYDLGPPLIPAQECHPMQGSMNPPYELEYWKYGLEVAQRWAERLGRPANPDWMRVAGAMARPPQQDGVYLAHEHCPDTFTEKNHDHPSMVGALGMLPGSLVDPEVMRNTLKRVQKDWIWESAWGWDFPMCAMTAARLGERELAVDFLLMEATKNRYLPNGHNYQRPGLSVYLPGNGGLLTAVAMMACGWDGADNKELPGFPQDGSWSVQWEGLLPLL
ncbi:glycoside hydrolase family 65 [Paenibacillus lemnae]|uniref:Glycoside hydrolase family 65 n=1 Tax=Paenibacillus lemnae TaxID=1330551 RepID=A0A848M446_PAELE|nr:glycoside hydrolase family 65 [Paenibacillus lemnae]NMO95029.1 glycoside hydrolase family 65 [Paenibacillus lemnae]